MKDKKVTIITLVSIVLTIILFACAIAVKSHDSGATSNSGETSYMNKIFSENEVMQVDIEMSEDAWNEMIKNATKEEYVTCNITINGKKLNTVGIRPKGNSSLSMVASDATTDRFSFKLDFGQYIDGQKLYGLDKMALNNIIGDTTYMKEYLSLDMFTQMGIATPAFAYANITVNGQQWGLYLATEILEKSFLSRNFGTLDGNLYKPESNDMGKMGQGGDKAPPAGEKPPVPNGANQGAKPQGDAQNMPNNGQKPQGNNFPVDKQQNNTNPTGDLQNQQGIAAPNAPNGQNQNQFPKDFGAGGGGPMGGGSKGTSLVYIDDKISSYSGVFDNTILKSTKDSDKDKVITMMKNLNQGTNLDKYLEVDEVLKYFAVNTFLVNLDSYAGGMKHNYYLYEEKGEFQILPWDFNLSFAGFQITDAKKAINFPIDKPVTDTMENSPLISKLLAVDEYKAKYHKYLQELISKYITSGKYENTIEKVDKLIGEYVKKDKTAFFTYEDYTDSLPTLVQFGKDRTKSIEAQIAGTQPSNEYGTLDTTVDLKKLGTMGRGKDGAQVGRGENQNQQGNPNQDRGANAGHPPEMMGGNDVIGENRLVREGSPLTLQNTVVMGIIAIISIVGVIFVQRYRRRRYTS